MKEVTGFKFTYTPWDKEGISQVDVYMVAKDRKEAELIALKEKHKFFDKDCFCSVKEIVSGYRR